MAARASNPPCSTKLSVHAFRADPCTACSKPAMHQYAELRRGKPRLWCCRKCHEARQTRSEHCAFCDEALPPGRTTVRGINMQYYGYRDAGVDPRAWRPHEATAGPLVPVCDHCIGSSTIRNLWDSVVAESELYDEAHLLEHDPERQWLITVAQHHTGREVLASRMSDGSLLLCVAGNEPMIPLSFGADSHVLEQRDGGAVVVALQLVGYPLAPAATGDDLARLLASAEQVFSGV